MLFYLNSILFNVQVIIILRYIKTEFWTLKKKKNNTMIYYDSRHVESLSVTFSYRYSRIGMLRSLELEDTDTATSDLWSVLYARVRGVPTYILLLLYYIPVGRTMSTNRVCGRKIYAHIIIIIIYLPTGNIRYI